MLKFTDKFVTPKGETRYKVYYDGKLIPNFEPTLDNAITRDGVAIGTVGDKCWSETITEEAVDLIEATMGCRLTALEEKQIFLFYYKGDPHDLEEKIKKHKDAIKRLKKQLKEFT